MKIIVFYKSWHCLNFNIKGRSQMLSLLDYKAAIYFAYWVDRFKTIHVSRYLMKGSSITKFNMSLLTCCSTPFTCFQKIKRIIKTPKHLC